MDSMDMRKDAFEILGNAVNEMLPDKAVSRVLESRAFDGDGKCVLVAIGKAAWTMAKKAWEILGEKVDAGLVVTKYGHSQGEIGDFEIIEAGHPLPDFNSVKGATRALEIVDGLSEFDQVIFLVSGGGSALFEKPMDGLDMDDIISVTERLLASGADIVEINKVRKHMSAVKGGRFAESCGEASILTIVLSDVLGDRLDAIASGPAYPDESTSTEALSVLDKYKIPVDERQRKGIGIETPKRLDHCETIITGSVRELCLSVARNAGQKGYEPHILASGVDCEARELGRMAASLAAEIHEGSTSEYVSFKRPCAIIIGGETVVRLRGRGKGGRNQEIALSAAMSIRNLDDIVIASIGSDGTDGPTDAAGGIVDGKSYDRMKVKGIDPAACLEDNDSYRALQASGDLIITGPTGTNVNDATLILIQKI